MRFGNEKSPVLDGWVGGWMDGFKAILRIVCSNQKVASKNFLYYLPKILPILNKI
jgi:hypothetical protein